VKTILIALRNLNRQKRRTFLLGGAIAFGITIVTLINGFAGSFVENVSENFSNILAGHIFVEGIEKTPAGREIRRIADDDTLLSVVENQDLSATFVSKRSEFTGALIFQGESIRQSVVGVDWEEEEYLRERLVLTSGEFDDMLTRNDRGERNGIILTEVIAEALNVQIGDRVIASMRTINGQQNVGEFVVRAISFDPGLFGQLSAYADLSYVNQLLTLEPGQYQTLGIFLTGIELIDEEVERYYEALRLRVDVFERNTEDEDENPVEALFEQADEQTWEGVRYRVYTLNDVLSEVDQVVRLLNGTALVILLVLFFIIMVGITNTFRMIMYERIKEIGTMRALGMQRSRVLGLFLLEAFFLAMGGVIAGLVLAGVIMLIVSQIYIGLDSTIFILLKNGYFTFTVRPLQVILNTAVVAGLTILAALLPSRRAANLPPVDALRAI
jgi:putative ABC transport system permease protein